MNIYTIDSGTRYLCLDINNAAPCRKLLVRENGTLVYDLDVYLAEPGMDSVRMFADLYPFSGRELTFWLADGETEVPFPAELTDRRAGEEDYLTHLRPLVHFTSRYGWNNDPNGLIYADGVYHMFYQHNPAGTRWGICTGATPPRAIWFTGWKKKKLCTPTATAPCSPAAPLPTTTT